MRGHTPSGKVNEVIYRDECCTVPVPNRCLFLFFSIDPLVCGEAKRDHEPTLQILFFLQLQLSFF